MSVAPNFYQGEQKSDLQFVDFPTSVPIKAYYKYQLAKFYGFSQETLVKFINRFIEDFEKLGYKKNDKLLSKQMVSLLFSKIGEP
jgi:hypothetical protein